MKKVCFVAAIEFTVRAFLLEHIRNLSTDYRVTVAVNTSDPAFLKPFGVEVEVIPLPLEREISPLRDMRAFFSLYWLFRSRGFFLVHSVTPKAGLLSMMAGFLARTPLRVHIFTGQLWASKKGAARAIFKAVDRVLASCATHVLVDSPSQKEFLVKEGVVPEGKATVIGHGSIAGVAMGRFTPDPKVRERIRSSLNLSETDTLFLFLGRLNRDKGVLDLARAFSLLRKGSPGAHLLVVGPDEGGLRREMENLCEGEREALHFIDYTESPEECIAGSDVLCLPSYREGFGVVVIEAASAGLPAIGSRIYGITDALEEGVTGLFHEPGDTAQLAKAMTTLAKDRDLRVRMGKDARERVRRLFSQQVVCGAFFDYYHHLLEGHDFIRPMRWHHAALKRLLDFCIALPVLIVLAPLLVACFLAIFFTMGSPVLFSQQRPGLLGRPFRILKLRTMNDERDGDGTLLPDEARLSRVGRLLRQLSLDEVPQLVNVLKGDLSLVGPRPLLMEYLPLYSNEQQKRHQVKPGITGWTQVNGRNALTWEEKFEMDAWYVDHWSLGLDVKILFLTLMAVLKRKGIGSPGYETMPKFTGSLGAVGGRHGE